VSGSGIRIAYVTAPSLESAGSIARALVSERMAGCVNLVPGMKSIYTWEGRIEEADEVVLIAKTTVERWPDLERRIRELHPYQTPCILGFDANVAGDAFARWILDATRPA
jgi:periplasmic divalent cation tolerance protein